MIEINLLKKGDEVISVNEHFIAIKRKCGKVDIYNLFVGEAGVYVDSVKAATIGYGSGIVKQSATDGDISIYCF